MLFIDERYDARRGVSSRAFMNEVSRGRRGSVVASQLPKDLKDVWLQTTGEETPHR
jgi:hypothetical protein